MSKIIIIAGPVGAGKSTVTRELVALLPAPLACIEGDKFWSFLAKTNQPDRRESFKVILRSMTAACLPFARSGYDVVLDFSVPPRFLDAARKIIKEVPLEYVLLQPSAAVCAARAAARKEGAVADYSNYLEFYSLFDAFDRYKITDDHADAAVVAAQIIDGLNHGKFSVP